MNSLPPDFVLDARTAVRVLCGVFFLPHTIAKLRNIDRASLLFDKVGFRPPRFFVVLTTGLEIVAAFGLISSLYPRVAAVIAAIILIGASYAIARAHTLNWRWQHPGIEYMLFWASVCLCVGFLE
ncbi:MAG: DoxX family protein [Xanthobacteraceae bacterium]